MLARLFWRLVLVLSTPALAQDNPFKDHPLPAARPDEPLPFHEPSLDIKKANELNALMEAGDWPGLRAAVRNFNDPKSVGEGLDWLKVRTDTGAPFIIPMIYSETLWMLGSAAKDEGLKGSAAFMALYTIAVIRMDGMACSDRTAPGHRMDQVAFSLGGPLRYFAGAKPEVKARSLKTIVALEAFTAAHRKAEDEIVCSGGLDQIKAGMDAQLLGEAKSVPGHIGKVVDVGTPKGWKPSFLPATTYGPNQAKFRGADLYDYLSRLIK